MDRFYTWSTILNPEERLENHLSDYYGSKKFTSKAKDWELFIAIECTSIEKALQVEQHIKKMKSKVYINNLKRFPELLKRLKAKYS